MILSILPFDDNVGRIGVCMHQWPRNGLYQCGARTFGLQHSSIFFGFGFEGIPFSKFRQQCKFGDSSFDTVLAHLAPSIFYNFLPRRECKVVRISFPSYPLSGILDDRFLELPDLEILNLANTKVNGYLAKLKKNIKLEWLVLRETGVSGHLNSLQNATQLEHLDVSGTSVSGDLVAVAKLEYLDASRTGVSGDLAAVANATNLHHLDVSGTSVSGDLVAVANAKYLQHLDVSGTGVSGDLMAVANATNLEYLDVSRTSVSGDLVAVANATRLWRLYVSGTSVSGDLAAVANATNLHHLDVSGTSVSGDLVAVANATNLRHLYVSRTSVAGNLMAVANATNLEHLDVSRTGVSGDLVAVANATNLEHLDVSGTSVAGDLVAVANAKYLQHLDVSGTEVSGDVGELTNAELRYLHLSGTKISGALFRWKEIQELHLPGTKVEMLGASFLEDFWPRDAQGKWICLFPSLKSFDVSGTPLSTSVEKLLRPFLGCRALQDIKAAECNLTGTIPSTLQVDSQGSFCNHSEWPVSQVLQVLDLASNSLTRVEALPPKCQAVILAGNPSMDFKTGVLKKAISNKVALDLQNVLFVNTQDTKRLLSIFLCGLSLVCKTGIEAGIGCVFCFN